MACMNSGGSPGKWTGATPEHRERSPCDCCANTESLLLRWPHTLTVDVHLHHDHRLHGLVSDPDHTGPSSLSLLMSGPVGLYGRSLVGSPLI
ncbi:hypothetical protein INR49_027340 [Caranx melampygus]|nr:hypothetical protein INR49_027340 [Caranx melampygus]